MNTKRWTAFLPLLLGVLLAAGCYYMPSGAQGSARASLALTKGLPANISSIALIVSGPGMKTMANEYPVGTSSVSLEVPAGLARTFTVLASTPSVTLRGEATADLVAGETKEILLSPVTFDSQIIVPDYYLNYRLVQISDMAGTGWIAVQYNTLGLGMTSLTQFQPYDVDFDSQGRIYVANYSDGVVRLDDINDTAAEWDLKGSVAANPVAAIAIDRTNQILYLAKGPALAKIDVSAFGTTPTPTPLIVTPTPNITGLAVGPDGSLYLTSYGGGFGGSLIKYDPVAGTQITSYASGSDWDPWDVTVQGGYVYTTHVLGDIIKIKKVARSDLNLKPIDEFTGPASDPFYGPRRFVAILSRKLTVIDEGFMGVDSNRLATFGDMAGSGWTTYGTTGSSTGQFEFFSQYIC